MTSNLYPPPAQSDAPAFNWSAFLELQLAQQTRAIQRYYVESLHKEVWIKRAQPARGPLLYWLLNCVASLLQLPWLKASPSARGGALSIAVEVRRLQHLHQAGVRVPRVLAATQGAFVMDDISADCGKAVVLQNAMTDANAAGQPQEVLALFTIGLNALLALHRKDQYLSQAFARNMVLNERGELGFIDFEDDPGEIMSLTDCKTRDLFCYLQSTAWPLAQAQMIEPAQNALAEWIQQYPALEQEAFQKATHQARFARFFSNNKRFGKDVVRIHNLYLLLQGIAKSKP